MISWNDEAIMFLLLFYAISNNSAFPETQPECCWDNTWDNIKQTPKEELEKFMIDIEKRNIAYFEPDPEERDYFSGVGGPTYD